MTWKEFKKYWIPRTGKEWAIAACDFAMGGFFLSVAFFVFSFLVGGSIWIWRHVF